jgi:catechol 2,3-dioxygenase-like lactoylglutathione lyase family enzyme
LSALAAADVIGFVATADAARSRRFYEDVLGLQLVADEPSATVFEANGTMLRVSKVREVVAAPYTVLGWRVRDIAAATSSLAAKGVRFEVIPGFDQDAQGIWTAPDRTKVAWFKDPDGNLLSLTEFPS